MRNRYSKLTNQSIPQSVAYHRLQLKPLKYCSINDNRFPVGSIPKGVHHKRTSHLIVCMHVTINCNAFLREPMWKVDLKANLTFKIYPCWADDNFLFSLNRARNLFSTNVKNPGVNRTDSCTWGQLGAFGWLEIAQLCVVYQQVDQLYSSQLLHVALSQRRYVASPRFFMVDLPWVIQLGIETFQH